MRKIAITLLLGLILSLGNSTHAEERRVVWDFRSLPELGSGQSRLVFGFNYLTSIQDDYSWRIFTPTSSYFQSVLAPCSQDLTTDRNYSACIEQVQFRKIGKSNWVTANLSNVQLGEPTTTIAKGGTKSPADVSAISYDPKNFIPPGNKATIWSMPGARHASGDDYLVRARFMGPINSVTGVDGGLSMRFKVELLPIAYSTNTQSITQDALLVEEFPQNFEYRIRLRTGVFIKAITGWFFGRITAPTIDRNGPLAYLDITGTPARIPIGATEILPTKVANNYIISMQCRLDAEGISMCLRPIDNKAGLLTSIDSTPDILNDFERAPGGVKTLATLSAWSLDSSFFESAALENRPIQECVTSIYGQGARVFQGAVFSNATMFQTSAPTWDSNNQSLSFKVAAPHFDEDLVPNKGFYTLYIPQEIAKCLWGDFVNSPIAEIQIETSEGRTSITTIANKIENGMLRFNISGFGYSSPTIRIRLARDIGKITSITCIKGKLTKKISGKSPNCPTGYKRKG